MKPLELHDENGNHIELKLEEVAETLDGIFSHFGYDPLEEYFNRFEKSNVFVCIMGSRSTRPDFLYTRTV
jgi:hypothetical protein